jgi:hypothetical protein
VRIEKRCLSYGGTEGSNPPPSSSESANHRFRCVVAAATSMVAYPEADRIRCYEYSVDDEYARDVTPLLRSGEKWLPAV